jgi:predicted Zn-dependent peptidase
MSSRLFQEIREKRGLCYDIHSDYWPFSDTGLFSIYGGTGERELTNFLPVMLDCLCEAAERPSEPGGRQGARTDEGRSPDGAGIAG